MQNEDFSNSVIFAKGEPLPTQIGKNITGQAYLNMIVPAGSPLD
ncbi:cupin domain-containing protein, partial [bacterium]